MGGIKFAVEIKEGSILQDIGGKGNFLQGKGLTKTTGDFKK